MKVLGPAAIIVALVVATWWWEHAPASKRAAPAAPAEAPAAPTGSAATAPGSVAPSRPLPPTALRRPAEVELPYPPAPAPPGDPVAPPVADSQPFEQEQRDASWAIDQERELKFRLDRLGADLKAQGRRVKIVGAECRRTLCRVEIEASAAGDLSALYGALETPEGLYGWADAIVLGQVDGDLATGTLRTSVVVQFDRN